MSTADEARTAAERAVRASYGRLVALLAGGGDGGRSRGRDAVRAARRPEVPDLQEVDG